MTALEPSKLQGIEAQKLISISLGKMAASRVGKGGNSLHKSLLVASVLHRARHVFLEENYHHYQYRHGPPTLCPVPVYASPLSTPPPPPCCDSPLEANDENRCSTPLPPPLHEDDQREEGVTSSSSCCPPSPRVPFADASNQQRTALKRRRCVSDKETQDAISSILPKRFRSCSSTSENVSPNCTSEDEVEADEQEVARAAHYEETYSSSFVGAPENSIVPISAPCDSPSSLQTVEYQPLAPAVVHACSDVVSDRHHPTSSATPNPIYCSLEPISDDEEDDDDDDDDVNSMEVEHITSLVSIFSFGAPRKDMCATQAAREDHAQFTPLALAV